MYQATASTTTTNSAESQKNNNDNPTTFTAAGQADYVEGVQATDYTELTFHNNNNNNNNNNNAVSSSGRMVPSNDKSQRSISAARLHRASSNDSSSSYTSNNHRTRSGSMGPPMRRQGTAGRDIRMTAGGDTKSTSAGPFHPDSSAESMNNNDNRNDNHNDINNSAHPPLLEIPEEVYAVRKSALQVLKPLTRSWVVVSVGFSLSVLFGMARWTRLLRIPFWFILLPSWCSHVGLLVCHILSARALSRFISEANESRQRPDSRDHLNRTEYLPLLQRSLKFGLKTGVLSFFVFMFEVLIYIQLAWDSVSLAVVFLPLWILVAGGILDGIICKTQHFLRVICWILICIAMTMTVLKVDYEMDAIRWRMIVSPVVALLSIISATLIYIVYGHQIGYYQLTESQLTAGNLYSLAALICIVLFVVIGEVIPLTRPVEIETRIFIVVMSPLVVCLVGMGAWVVSRDEFGRLLLYGGQSAVHPMRLQWESDGWTSVQSKGVTTIPMFGEVSFRPLENRNQANEVDMCGRCSCCSRCTCCTWYPYEDEESPVEGMEDIDHPYLRPDSSSLRINEVLQFR